MSDAAPVVRRSVEILNFLGLHLRPAARFVNLAGTFQSEIRVRCHDTLVNGKSILDLTLLAAEQGTWVELEACGPDADQAVGALADLVAHKFYEEETETGAEPQSPTPPQPDSNSVSPAHPKPDSSPGAVG